MPYGYDQGDNASIELLVKAEEQWARDIISNYDMFIFKGGFKYFKQDRGEGKKISWPVQVNMPSSYPSAYPMAPQPAQPYQRRINAELNFVPRGIHLGIPWEEMDMFNADSDVNINLKSKELGDGAQQFKQILDAGFWNGTGNHLLGTYTGADAAVNDAIGVVVYAGISRAAFQRWEANIRRGAWTLWYGTLNTIILPLWIRSEVMGKKPDIMAVGMTVYSAMNHMMMERQFSYKVNPKAAAQGLGATELHLWDMMVLEGGTNMPGGADTTQIFGFTSSDIALRYITRALIETLPWKPNYDNHFDEAVLRTHCQWMWGTPENHFRCFDCIVPADPTEPPGET